MWVREREGEREGGGIVSGSCSVSQSCPVLDRYRAKRAMSGPLLHSHVSHLTCRCDALQSLTQVASLEELVIEGPLCHTPQMASAVTALHTLPRLHTLSLWAAECAHGHPDMADAMWAGGEETWGAEVWVGVFSMFRSLRNLGLELDSIPQPLHDDLMQRLSSGLTRLCVSLRGTGFGIDFQLAPCDMRPIQLPRIRVGAAHPLPVAVGWLGGPVLY